MRLRKISEKWLVPIVADGGIQDALVGEGRLIPVIVLDCSKHFNLRELVVQHKHFKSGDVLSNWGKRPFQNKTVSLYLHFIRPLKLEIVIEFEVERYADLIDGIMLSQGAYIQPAEFGRTVSAGFFEPKIIVEIPTGDFFPSWDKMFHKHIERKAILRGIDKAKAKDTASQYIREHRAFLKHRIPDR